MFTCTELFSNSQMTTVEIIGIVYLPFTDSTVASSRMPKYPSRAISLGNMIHWLYVERLFQTIIMLVAISVHVPLLTIPLSQSAL